MTTLDDDTRAEVDILLAGLRDDGYQPIAEHGRLRAGARVRARSHQWPGAAIHGTGTVLEVTEKPGSSWAREYGTPDIEILVVWDEPRPAGWRVSQLAQYHVDVADVQPEAAS